MAAAARIEALIYIKTVTCYSFSLEVELSDTVKEKISRGKRSFVTSTKAHIH